LRLRERLLDLMTGRSNILSQFQERKYSILTKLLHKSPTKSSMKMLKLLGTISKNLKYIELRLRLRLSG